jgi:hypothetical protein
MDASGSGGAGIGGAASAALGVGATAINPFLGLGVSALLSLLGGLGSSAMQNSAYEKQQQRAMQIANMLKPKSDPYLKALSPAAFEAVIQQLARSGNWGWGEGKQIDPTYLLEALGQGKTAAATNPLNRYSTPTLPGY